MGVSFKQFYNYRNFSITLVFAFCLFQLCVILLRMYIANSCFFFHSAISAHLNCNTWIPFNSNSHIRSYSLDLDQFHGFVYSADLNFLNIHLFLFKLIKYLLMYLFVVIYNICAVNNIRLINRIYFSVYRMDHIICNILA